MSANIVNGIEDEIIGLFNDWTNLHYNSEYSETRGHALHVLLSVHVMEFSES